MDPPADQGDRRVAPASAPERVLVSLLTLGVVAAQLAFRGADDNRLTSWRWVFDGTDPARLFALVAAAIAVAHLAARPTFPTRRPALVLFVSAYAAAACSWRAPEVIVDASRYFTQAKHLAIHGLGGFLSQWGREIPAWTDLPLVPALYGLVLRIFGEDRVHLQAFTALLFAGSVVLAYRIGKALWDEEVGFAGAALLLAIPYLLTQVPSMLVDVPTMFFVTLAVLAVVHAVQRGGAARILLASVAVALALLSKYSAWLLLSGVPAIAVAHRKVARSPLRAAALVALGSGLLALAALLPLGEVWSRQLALLVGYQAPGLRRWGESFVSTFLFQVHPFLTAAALVSAWLAVRRRDGRWVAVAWPVLLLLVLDVRRIRYWVPAFPMLALTAAYGLQAIRTAPVRRLVVTCAVASSLVVALYGHLGFLARTSAANLKAAGAYLDAIDERAVEVFTPPRPGAEVNPAVSVPILDLFTRKQVFHAYAAPTPPPRAERSPLRFTWEYRVPRHYATAGPVPGAAVAVISDDLAAPLPPELELRLKGLRLARVFATDEGVFEHRTLVRVYRAPELASVPAARDRRADCTVPAAPEREASPPGAIRPARRPRTTTRDATARARAETAQPVFRRTLDRGAGQIDIVDAAIEELDASGATPRASRRRPRAAPARGP